MAFSIHHMAQPRSLEGNGHVEKVVFENMIINDGGELAGTGTTFSIWADVVFKAIGQRLRDAVISDTKLDVDRGKIVVDDKQATSIPGVWAGGDCVTGGDDLTVSAVQHGKVAAIAIDHALRA